MTVSTSYTFDLSLEGLCLTAMQMAGVLGADESPDGNQVAMGGRFLNIMLKGWQGAVRMLRQVENVTKTVTSGADTVTVDADTIDIEFPAYIAVSTGTQTYRVDRMSLTDYNAISNKAQQGFPTRALVERKSAVAMKLWPVPDANVVSITYTRVFLMKDILAGYTADAQQRYIGAITAGLARDYSEHFGKDDAKIARFDQRYQDAMGNVRRDNAESGTIKFSLR